MQTALDAHKKNTDKPAARGKPLLAEQYAAAKNIRKGECIHCHQIYEFRRADLKAAGQWSKDAVWVYPLPENLGIELDVDQGNKVKAVKADSPAAKAGLRPGDLMRTMNQLSVSSFGDAQFALHRAPAKGPVPLAWERGGQPQSASLEVPEGWRKTNPTWRPSLLDLFPSLTIYGPELSAAEKKALGLADQRLAFRQEKDIHVEAKKLGVQPGDVIIGIDGQKMEMSRSDFLGHIRRNFLIGDQLTLDVLRGGKPVGLPITLK
jgi:S1-C subfamily serine protease